MAANVAAALSQFGFKVTVIDLDPQNALRLHFGIPLQDSTGFASALINPAATPPCMAFLRQSRWGIGLLPFGQVDTAGALAIADTLTRYPERLTQLLQNLATDPRQMVIVDSPPGPSAALSAALPYVDMLICVLMADAISAALIPNIETGRAFGPGTQQSEAGGRLRYILNQVDFTSRLSRATAEAVRPYLGARLLGEIRWDDLVAEAAAGQCPLPFFAPHSPASEDFTRIAQGIVHAFGNKP